MGERGGLMAKRKQDDGNDKIVFFLDRGYANMKCLM